MFSIRDTQVVVLMGGWGRRIKEVEPNLPKSMIRIWGKPFFYYQLQLMKWQGLRNFVFCIGYKADIIKNYFKDGKHLGVKIMYSNDGRQLLGTQGALRKASPLLKDDFMLIYGDSYMDVDYAELLYTYYYVKEKGKKGLMVVFKNENKLDKSNIIFKNGKLLKYDKSATTSKMHYIDYGISILNRKVATGISSSKNTDLFWLYQKMIKDKLMDGYEVYNRFYEIGTPSSLEEFRSFIYHRFFVKKPAVFLDRDGTLNQLCLNEDTGLIDSPLKPEEMVLLPKTIEALHLIKSLGYLLIMVTNQPAAAKGKTRLFNLYEVDNRLKDILAKRNIYFDDVFLCPHHPIGSVNSQENFLIRKCSCRKPGLGFLMTAKKKFNIDVEKSYMVGDSYTDILAGKSAKLKSVFLGQYKCDSCNLLKGYRPDYVFDSLYNFAVYLKGKQG